MAKPVQLTRRDVTAIVSRRKRGVARDAIAEETGFHRNVVSAVLTDEGLSKTSAANRRRYRERVDSWLAKK